MSEVKFEKVKTVVIDEGSAGQRIDNYLVKTLKGVPKTHVYKILRKGEVRVNKKRIKANYKLELEDLVRIPPIKLQQTDKPSVNLNQVKSLEQAILYESDALIVLNKPSGMAVHGGSGLSFGVIEALRQLRPQAKFLELVHRLDRDTSGCLLIAKKRSTLKYLHEQLREKTLDKRYQALVIGKWPKRSRIVNLPLKKNTLQSGERVVRVDNSGKEAVTEYSVIRNYKDCTLVEASPITGRTHQIRVHCQANQHPIIGDTKYCETDVNRAFAELGFNRLMLHAASIEFRESGKSEPKTVTAEWPEFINSALEQLCNR